MRRARLGCFVWLAGCASFTVGEEATGGAAGGATQAATTTTGPSSTASTSASTSAIASATSSSSSGDPSGDRVYTRDAATGSWTSTPVELFWPGTDAPPPKGISAVADLQKFDDLFVFVDNGATTIVHRRREGLWVAPAGLSQVFAGLPDATRIESSFHVPYWSMQTSGCGPPPSPDNESIRLVTFEGAVWDFDVTPTGDVFERSEANNPDDWQTGLYAGPALPTWSVEVAPDPDACGTLGWFTLYALMGGTVYFADGTLVEPVDPDNPHFLWQPLGGPANPIFSGAPNEPTPAAMQAGFYDRPTQTFGFVGP